MGYVAEVLLAAGVGLGLTILAAVALTRSRRRATRIAWSLAVMVLAVVTLTSPFTLLALQPVISRAALPHHPAPVPDTLSIIYNGIYGTHPPSAGIHALRARDASLRWQLTLPSPVNHFTLVNGLLYVASDGSPRSAPPSSATLVALRTSDGAQLWTVPIVNPALRNGMPPTTFLAAPVIVGDTILLSIGNSTVSYDTGLVIALQASDHREIWRKVIDRYGNVFAGSDDLFFVGSPPSDHHLRAFHIRDGSLAWQVAVNSYGSQAVYEDGVVYVSPAGAGQITALRASDGKLLWAYGDPAQLPEAVVLTVSDGTAYAGGTDLTSPPNGIGFNQYLYALDAISGKLRWRFQAPSAGGLGSVSGVTTAGDTVFVGTTGALYALDAATGSVRWRQSTGTFVAYESPQFADGMVFAASGDVRAHISFGCASCEPDYFNALNTRDGSFYWRAPLAWSGSQPPVLG